MKLHRLSSSTASARESSVQAPRPFLRHLRLHPPVLFGLDVVPDLGNLEGWG